MVYDGGEPAARQDEAGFGTNAGVGSAGPGERQEWWQGLGTRLTDCFPLRRELLMLVLNRGTMSLFSETAAARETGKHQSNLRPAAAVFLVSILVGTLALWWQCRTEAARERARAQAEARACISAIELQFTRAVQAAESLAAIVRSTGGSPAAFQRAAEGIQASVPAMASVELQPAGIVREILPRTGHGHILGLNVLRDAVHGPGAHAAIRAKATTVLFPMTLYGGEPGLVVRVPIFQSSRTGREEFWGLVAVSLNLTNAFARAGLEALSPQGLEYFLFAITSPGKALALSPRMVSDLENSAQHAARVGSVELRLAVRPSGGWYGVGKLLLESLVVVVLSAIIGLLAHTVLRSRGLENLLAEEQRKLAGEAGERQRLETDSATIRAKAESEVSRLRAALQAAASSSAQQTNAVAAAHESRQAAENAAKDLENQVTQLQARLNEALQSQKALAATQADLRSMRERLASAEAKNRDLEALAARSSQAEQAAQAALGAAQDRARAELEDLQAKLQAHEREAAGLIERHAGRLKEAEALNGSLSKRVSELEGRLEQSSNGGPESADAEITELQEKLDRQARESADSAEKAATRVREAEALNAKLAARVSELEHELATIEGQLKNRESVARVAEPASEIPPPAEKDPENLSSLQPTPPPESAVATPATITPPEPTVRLKSATSGRRRRKSEDNQPELFGTEAPEVKQPGGLTPGEARPARRNALETTLSTAGAEEEDGASAQEQPAADPEPAAAEEAENGVGAVESWPEIRGLSIADALERKQNSARLWDALRDFVETHSRTPDDIEEALVRGDSKAAARNVQKLQAAAEDIGADVVASSATALTKALEGGSDPASLEQEWEILEKALRDLITDLKAELRGREAGVSTAKRSVHSLEIDVAQLRRATGQIVPLLGDRDPGAKDCFKAFRNVFRSAFPEPVFRQFEQLLKAGDYEEALEQLRKTSKKFGIHV